MIGPGGPKPGGAGGLKPRMGGGFNQAMGQFGEHLDESAFKQASSQKALGQQGAQVSQQQMAAAQAQAAQQQSPGTPAEPREVGTIPDEAKRVVADIWADVKSFFSIHTWLGIKPNTLTPEEQNKAKTVHQRYKQLDQEQQQEARRRYEKEMKRRQKMEEEKQRKAQQEAQANQSSVEVPSGPKKGPVGPSGNKKQKAVQKLQNDRKTLSGPGSAN